MKQLFFFLLLAIPFLSSAQSQKTGNLTIFSEDGDSFILFLNGEKQNNKPQSNLRIEDLPQPYYNAKIIFTDSSIMQISKNNLLIADPDGVMMDVTYKIKKDKASKAKLNYFSSIPVKQDYIPPAGVSVYHYGQPPVSEVTTIRTTTTSGNNNEGVSASVNMPGISMNVVITDPSLGSSSSTTTTTTTISSSSSGTRDHQQNNQGNSSGNCKGMQMSQADFSSALKTIGNGKFDDTKLSTAKSISGKNCLSADQVVSICNLFSFEDSKLDFAKYAYKRTTDQKNYFKVSNVFSFDSSKDELSNFISDD